MVSLAAHAPTYHGIRHLDSVQAKLALVNDAHGDTRNLLPDELDPRAELISGKPKPLNMFEGLAPDHAGVICLGYHARARDAGVLAHTTNGFAFGRIRLNDAELGEAGCMAPMPGALVFQSSCSVAMIA